MAQFFFSVGLVLSVSAWSQIIISPTNSNSSETSEYEKEMSELLQPPPNKKAQPAATKKSNVQPVAKPAVQPKNKTLSPEESKNWNDENSAVWQGGPKRKEDLFVIGFELRSYKYEEPGIVTHQGFMYGIYGQAQFVFESGDLDIYSSLTYGKLQYDGALCDSLNNCTPTQTEQTDLLNKTQATWNFNPFVRNSDFYFKVGLGSRYLSDRYDQAGFYTRIGLWAYIPVGMGYYNKINSDWALNADFEYQQVVYGSLKSYLSELNSNNPDLDLKQTGYGLEARLGFNYAKKYQAVVFVDQWNLNESEIQSAQLVGFPLQDYSEPANNALSFGLRLGYNFY